MRQEHNQRFWLGLHLIPQFGIAKITQLLAHFASAAELWQASDQRLLQLELPRPILRQFIAGRKSIDLDREWEAVRKVGASLITIECAAYPDLLRSLSDRPPLLYIRGELDSNNKRIAIVGTRKPSRYGLDAAEQLAYNLAQEGVTIVSGLAHGIDAAAHRGALRAGGRTIAVMATGIDRIYPQDNVDLAREIVEAGAIITEMPIGVAPLAKNFPQRNRIISGMSLGVLVAEAPEKSGAMNTVTHASEQGRDVFALPHNIFSQSGRGSNALIQDGAKLVMRVGDVLEELNIAYQNNETRIETEQIQPTNNTEALILHELGADPVHVDLIVRRTNLPASTVASTLTLLELKGLAETAGHMQYCRAR